MLRRLVIEMNLNGHFEKGAWIPGVLDGVLAAIGGLAPYMEELRQKCIEAGNIEIYGHFEKGAWISVRLCDLTWSVPDELLSED